MKIPGLENLFGKKCPVCGMKLEKGRAYPEGYGKTFCSESCKAKYGADANKKESRGCCG